MTPNTLIKNKYFLKSEQDQSHRSEAQCSSDSWSTPHSVEKCLNWEQWAQGTHGWHLLWPQSRSAGPRLPQCKGMLWAQTILSEVLGLGWQRKGRGPLQSRQAGSFMPPRGAWPTAICYLVQVVPGKRSRLFEISCTCH